MLHKVIRKDKVAKVKASQDMTKPGETLCKLTDTGNGFIAKFPAWTSIEQDYYVCLDYAQAADLYAALSTFSEVWE